MPIINPMAIRKLNILALLVMVVVTLASCDNDTIYYHYEHAAVSGWEKNDSLTYDVPSVVRPGDYSAMVGIRVDGKYPFQTLSLIVEQTIFCNADAEGKRKRYKSHDAEMISCRINNSNGTPAGRGTSYIQYEVPLTMTASLAPGDSIHYTVRHNMKRSILPGIADVGIKLRRKAAPGGS